MQNARATMGPAVPCTLVQFQNFMAKAECNAVPRNLSRDRSSMWQDVYGVPHLPCDSDYDLHKKVYAPRESRPVFASCLTSSCARSHKRHELCSASAPSRTFKHVIPRFQSFPNVVIGCHCVVRNTTRCVISRVSHPTPRGSNF